MSIGAARPYSKDGRLPGLDTLRSAAILLVVIFHLQSFLPSAFAPVARIGWTGVDLFFVLSGFLIGLELLRPYAAGARPSLRLFYLKRSLRILPPYFVVLALYLLWPLWPEFPGPVAPSQFWTFTWNLLLIGFPDAHAFSHSWSLCVEEHFYLLLPAVLLVLMRRPSAPKAVCAISLLIVGGAVLRGWLFFHAVLPAGADQAPVALMRYIYYPTYSRLDGLVVGVALAAVKAFRPAWWQRGTQSPWLMLGAGVLSLASALALFGAQAPAPEHPLALILGFPALAVAFGFLLLACAGQHSPLAARVPGARMLATLSFSLYLTHKGTAHVLQQLLPRLTARPDWLAAVLYAVGCVGASALLFLAVERPSFALRATLARRLQARPDQERALAAGEAAR